MKDTALISLVIVLLLAMTVGAMDMGYRLGQLQGALQCPAQQQEGRK